MKKLFYLLLVAILVMGLAACSSSQNAGIDSAEVSDAAEESYEVIATLMINTEGMGIIAYGLEGEDVEFDEDFPNQSTVVNLTEPGTYVIKAKPDDGWKFIKWTKDGADFSEDPDITVEVTENVEYIAVFDVE
ncbi:MAG: hypothetical protein IJJ06_07290 [Mogibacterium sp.]|nr:hypothetical protein [Mogibacterium sp.]